MIPYREAQKIISKEIFRTQPVQVSLDASVNRILAEDVISDVNMPPFDKAAVDGYACRRSELTIPLLLDGVVQAGDDKIYDLQPGRCIKIMTGARVPKGADCIFMVENSRVDNENHVFFTGDKTSDNIAKFGEDVKIGDRVLTKGIRIMPKHIGLLAAMGKAGVFVYDNLRAGVITTGSEIVEPEQKPEGTNIRNSNGPQLMTQLASTGVIPHYYGIVDDNLMATRNWIEKSVTENDITLITGGVSMGDYDFVKTALKDLGAEILIEKIAIKPGKPTVLARIGKKYVFGMPGNPVSTFVIFEVFVKPFLLACMGSQEPVDVLQLPWAKDVQFRLSDRASFVPIVISELGEVQAIEYHGSAHIFSLCGASGVACIEIGKGNMKKGERVDVRLF